MRCDPVPREISCADGEISKVSTYNYIRSEKLIRTPRLMATYDDETLELTPPVLAPGEKEHVLVPKDKCINHTNDIRKTNMK